MNILVCIKQVPDTAEIKIDPVTNTLIRAGVPSIVNPFDAYALEIAARIKDKNPGTKIVLVSMGPQQATAALKECLAVGGDKAYLVSDRAFGGADTLATSYTLKNAIDKIEELEGKFDLIFCGKQAIAKGIKAGEIIKNVTAICGGKGGGKPDSAMGGGNDLLKLDDALAKVDDLVAEKLGL